MKKIIVLFARHTFPVIITFILVFGVFTGAQASVDFTGKTIVFIVPSSAGGGTDVFGRLIAIHIKRHLPGGPSIVIRNISTAGGLAGTNIAYMAKPNGRTVLVSTAKIIMSNVLRSKGVEFTLEKMLPLYASPSGAVIYAKANVISSYKDIMTAKGIIYGDESPLSGSGSFFVWAKELLGFKTEKTIFGYGGAGETRLAFHAGEINYAGESTLGYNETVKPYVEKGEVVPLFQSGMIDDNGNIVREPAAPDVPTLQELYEQIYGKKPSGPVFDVIKLIVGARSFGKAINLPPSTPFDIIDTYRDAVAKMVKDPKFLKDSENLNSGAPHFYGEKFEKAYAGGITAAPKVIEFMKETFYTKYGVVFK